MGLKIAAEMTGEPSGNRRIVEKLNICKIEDF